MSRRVLPVILYVLIICPGAPHLFSAEPAGPELPIPLVGPTGPAPANRAQPLPAPESESSRGRPIAPALRVAGSSNLRWVQADERPDSTQIEPIPLAASPLDHELLPPAEAWTAPTPAPVPALAEETEQDPAGRASEDPEDVPQKPEAYASGIVQTAPSLIVEIAGPSRTSVGAVASFHIFLKNMGVATAKDVDVQAILPQDADVVVSDPPSSAANGKLVQFDVGDLAAEEVRRIRIDLIPRATGPIRLHANVGFSVAASSSIQVSRTQLAVRCEAPAATALGDVVTFRVVVENTGNVQSQDITVIPQVASLEQTQLSSAGQFQIGTLQPGATKEIVLRAVASREGTMQVRFLASDQSGSEAVAETRVRVRPSGVNVMLIGPAEVRPGEENNYELQISNATEKPAENVSVTCSLPQGFVLTVVERAVQFAPQFAGMTWRAGRLAAGTNQTLQFKAKSSTIEGDYSIRTELASDSLPNGRASETAVSVRKQLQYHRTASLRR